MKSFANFTVYIVTLPNNIVKFLAKGPREYVGRESDQYSTNVLFHNNHEAFHLQRFLASYTIYLSTAPSDGPASVTVDTITPNSITVQWEEVPCLDQNGQITGYTVVARNSGEDDGVVNVNDGNARAATVYGLNPNTQYDVSIAAVNRAGTGPATSISVQTKGEHVVYIMG